MFLQFLDLYGNPVHVRPELVAALRGIAVTWEGKPRAATLILMNNRETFRLRGDVDAIRDGIYAWMLERSVARIKLGIDPDGPVHVTGPSVAQADEGASY